MVGDLSDNDVGKLDGILLNNDEKKEIDDEEGIFDENLSLNDDYDENDKNIVPDLLRCT